MSDIISNINGYYYPYYLHFLNGESFTYLLKDRPILIENNNIDYLWAITRRSDEGITYYYTASYNYYTKIYTFNEKKYILYDELVKDALTM
jgi:hypothetical protein